MAEQVRRPNPSRVMNSLILTAALFVTAFPFLWLVQMSFKTELDALAFPPKLLSCRRFKTTSTCWPAGSPTPSWTA